MFASPKIVTNRPVNIQGILGAIAHGEELTQQHIAHFVSGVVGHSIEKYQATAFLMGVRCCGMTPCETTFLTQSMTDSGRRLDLSGVQGTTVDKHSSGGISDGTSFVVAPLLATYGLKVPMMSGRGLAHTGGTLDKLEAIPGFRVNLSEDEIVSQLNAVGLAIFSQTADIAPADKVLYGLRDVTATVDSIPLIAASIMSKKLAEGADSLVMNVTTGTGAFMSQHEDARELAKTMVAIAQQSGKRASAVITSMDLPLGPYVGNALEIYQAIMVLKGGDAPVLCQRYVDVSIELAAELLIHSGCFLAGDVNAAKQDLRTRLRSGAAFPFFRNMVAAQGGDVRVIDDPSRLPKAPNTMAMKASTEGYLRVVDATKIGWASVYLGAGRLTDGARVDPAVGITLNVAHGQKVFRGQPVALLHHNGDSDTANALQTLASAFRIEDTKPEDPELIVEHVD